MNEALDLILDACALVRTRIRNPQELEDVSVNICQYSGEAASGG